MFIDRDGTLIKEAPPTYQVDSWDKLEFYPEVFFYMKKIADDFGYALVMVTNQDGLGTDSFPEENFWPVQNFLMKALENEGILFTEVLIDRSFASDNVPTRKPGTGLLANYISDNTIDWKSSFVIGDRLTDLQLASNLGCQSIWLNNDPSLGAEELNDSQSWRTAVALETSNWKDIYEFLSIHPFRVCYYEYA